MRKWFGWVIAAAMAVAAASCASLRGSANPDYDAARPHHRPEGFVNRYQARIDKPGFWRWQWERRRDGLPRPPAAPVVGVAPDLAFLRDNRGDAAVTWIGHATVLLQVDGVNILTDPQWSERASPIAWLGPTRHQPPGVAFDDLPRIDAVVISHNHYDHLDRETVQRLMARHAGIRFYVPLGVQHWFRDNVEGSVIDGPRRNVIALDWDDTARLPGRSAEVVLQLLAVQHWSARTPWDRQHTLWGSWAVLHPRFRFWFSGDLGYSPDTRDIGRALGHVDLAAIAIGAYEPRWFMKDSHVDPAEAVQVMQDVGARAALGVHWGTFEGLTDESLDQPPRDLQAALAGRDLDFRTLRHGQTWRFPARRPG